jgi:hypothetical protein
VAAFEGRDGRDVVPIFITLDEDCEFSLGFHKRILTCEKARMGLGLERSMSAIDLSTCYLGNSL